MPDNLSLADRFLEGWFSIFVIAVVTTVGFVALRYQRHVQKTFLGTALAIAVISLLPAVLVRFVIALTGNTTPSVLVWLVWLEYGVACLVLILVGFAPRRFYEFREPPPD
jgi:high-affinity Fe2+/Pb2+ permease